MLLLFLGLLEKYIKFKGGIMKNYYINKQKAIDKAIEFQITLSAYNYSYAELVEKQNYFRKLGKKYGLIKEFKENGIL